MAAEGKGTKKMEEMRKGAKKLHDGPEIAGPYRKDEKFMTDSCLRRYLDANEGNVKRALKQLQATIEWRRTYKPWEPCSKCLKDPFAHNMRVVGFDTKGRAVIYSCFAQAYDRWDADKNLKHMCWVLEQAAPLMEERGATKWTWISDFHGFSASDCSPKSMILVKNVLAHYPERLFKAVILDAPWLFNGLWNIVTPLLEERTKEKICFFKSGAVSEWVPGAVDGDTELEAFFKEELLSNRITPESPDARKKYWVVATELKGNGEGEEEEGKKTEEKDTRKEARDFRATPSVGKDPRCVETLFQYSLLSE
eukprot:CAMPEP_0184490614 /NCGR_PEP_ID=MMETSP0113_2-20130426/18334_1 /TAXON_ID=91329 /ORGANISM="Norrisiella sphaerica, Strain BC52" /LENGTH=308 /DNA_ID=CAMNT_0026874571 /DNA_START=15 /DNA_END=941 /DNA_ORIENTATION=-